MKELHVYDFDGTLFRSPEEPDWWRGENWWVTASSLKPPCVPQTPDNSWWVNSTVESARRSIQDPDILTVLMTGRPEEGQVKTRILELLSQQGLEFAGVFPNPGVQYTKEFKHDLLIRILDAHPELQQVQIWEDRASHLTLFDDEVLSRRIRCVPHWVKEQSHQVACTEKGFSSARAEPDMARIFKNILRKKLGRTVQSPPKMEHEVLSWIRHVFAGHVLQKIDRYIHESYHYNQELEEKKEIAVKVLGEYTQKIESLKEGDFWRLALSASQKLTVKRIDQETFGWGPGTLNKSFTRSGSKEEVKVWVLNFLTRVINRLTSSLEKNIPEDGLEDEELVELNLIKKECLKYTSGPKKYKTKASRKFPIDLTGWKYLDETRSEQLLANSIGKGGNLSVTLNFLGHSRKGGHFKPSDFSLAVYAGPNMQDIHVSLRDFRENLLEIESLTIHELTHMAQSLLTNLKVENFAGLPSKKVLTDLGWGGSTNALTKSEHAMMDVEFYTDLNDDLKEFLLEARRLKKEDRNRFLRLWVGIARPEDGDPKPYRYTYPSVFFKVLRREAPAKYKAALKLFTTEALKKIDMPKGKPF